MGTRSLPEFTSAFVKRTATASTRGSLTIKGTIDQKVYDRNDILKKDAYFEQTVMTEITAGMKTLGLANSREDRVFIQSRIAKQYLAQYNEYYPVA